MNNDRVTESDLISWLSERGTQGLLSKEVLCLHDTTEIKLSRHRNRLKADSGWGEVGFPLDIGFFLHASMLVDAQNFNVCGISHTTILSRPVGRTYNKHTRKQRPASQKESYRWRKGMEYSAKRCEAGISHLIHIKDREGDIYENYAWASQQAKQELLVRCRSNRRIVGSNLTLYDHLQAMPFAGTISLQIADNKKRQNRQTFLQYRYSPVTICRSKYASKNEPDQLHLYVVQAVEVPHQVPKGESAVDWKILTTYPVKNAEDAQKVLGWYSKRWLIEELFRVIKTKGYNLEASELENVYALRKLAIMVTDAASRILQLKQARDGSDLPIDSVFTDDEQECLKSLNEELEGKTEKQKNPYPDKSIAYASWVIARLGGWMGYASQRKPGVITFTRGYESFEAIFKGFMIAKKINSS